jgi:hypothetical protein
MTSALQDLLERHVASGTVPGVVALCAYNEGPWGPIAVRVADEVVGFVMWDVDSTDGGDQWLRAHLSGWAPMIGSAIWRASRAGSELGLVAPAASVPSMSNKSWLAADAGC